jgi:hypothetical protein
VARAEARLRVGRLAAAAEAAVRLQEPFVELALVLVRELAAAAVRQARLRVRRARVDALLLELRLWHAPVVARGAPRVAPRLSAAAPSFRPEALRVK